MIGSLLFFCWTPSFFYWSPPCFLVDPPFVSLRFPFAFDWFLLCFLLAPPSFFYWVPLWFPFVFYWLPLRSSIGVLFGFPLCYIGSPFVLLLGSSLVSLCVLLATPLFFYWDPLPLWCSWAVPARSKTPHGQHNRGATPSKQYQREGGSEREVEREWDSYSQAPLPSVHIAPPLPDAL